VGRMTSLRSLPVLFVALSMFLDLLTDLLLAALRGYARFHAIARTTVVRSAASLLAMPAFVLLESSLGVLTFAFLVSSAAGLVYTAWQSRDLFAGEHSGGPSNKPGRLGPVAMKIPWAFGISAILGSVYLRLGPAVLARMGGGEVGIYGAAAKIVDAGMFAASIVCSILVPYLSATRAVSEEQFRHMVKACMRLLIIPSFLCANVLIAIAHPLTRLLYGPRFEGAGTVLQVLSLFLLLGAVTGGAQYAILISLGEMRFASWMMGAALLAGLPLNVVLASHYGAVGAAASACIGEVCMLAANLVLLARRGLDAQSPLVALCGVLTLVCVVTQHLPGPAPLLAPIGYATVFGWRCLRDLRWSVGALSQGRLMMVRAQCG